MADVLIASATARVGSVVRNIGDEALTEGLVEVLSRRGHRVVASLSGIAEPPPGRVCLSRPTGLLRAVRSVDLVVLGGGTLLAGHVDGATLVPRGHPRHLAAVAAVAAVTGRPVAVVGVGAERWPGGAEHHLLRGVVRRAEVVGVRDADSAELVAERCGRSPGRSGDTFFGLELPPPVPLHRRRARVVVALSGRTSPSECALVAAGLTQWPHAEVWIRRMDQAGDDDAVASSLEALLAAQGRKCRVLPFVNHWRDAYDDMATAQHVVASRLHGLIFAARAGTPASAVGTSPKVVTFARDAGIPLWQVGGTSRWGVAVVPQSYLRQQEQLLDAAVDEVVDFVPRAVRGRVRARRREEVGNRHGA